MATTTIDFTVQLATDFTTAVPLANSEDLLVTKTGKIIETGFDSIGIAGGTGSLITVDGLVQTDHSQAITLADTSKLVVHATAHVTGKSGVLMDGLNDILFNSGLIQGTEEAVVARENGASITNTGSISGAIGVQLQADNGKIVNHGAIVSDGSGDAYGFGHALDMSGTGNTVVNDGDIEGASGVIVGGAGNTVDNSGTIFGTDGSIGAIFVQGGASSANTIKNHAGGLISGAVDAIQAVSGNVIVSNAGVIDGNVSLGAGSDKFDSHLGKVHGIVSLGGGNDSFIGSAGADKVIGGGGADHLTGLAGADTFVFRTIADSTPGLAGRDVITDFSTLQHDRLDLHTIDANAGLAGDQAFAFLGSGAFTHHAGELRYAFSGTNTLVSADVNGDGAADFAVLLNGHVTLHATDFLL